MDEREAYKRYLEAHLTTLVGTATAFRTYGVPQEVADYHRLIAEWKVCPDLGERARLRERMNLITDAVQGRVLAARARESGDEDGAVEIETRLATWIRRRKVARGALDRLGLLDVGVSVDSDDGSVTLSFRREQSPETSALVRQFAAELRAELGERRLRRVQIEYVGPTQIPPRVLKAAIYLARRFELSDGAPQGGETAPRPLQLLR